ncbi:hypothetical protein VPH35_096472 [Triticum aestivum]
MQFVEGEPSQSPACVVQCGARVRAVRWRCRCKKCGEQFVANQPLLLCSSSLPWAPQWRRSGRMMGQDGDGSGCPGRGPPLSSSLKFVSVYKNRDTLLYPFTCARAVGAASTTTSSRTGEVSQGKTEAQDNQSNVKAKTTKSRGTKQVPPARPLPGQLAPHQQSEPPLSPRPPAPSSTWGHGSGRHLCGGIQIFVKTYSRSDED